MIFSHYFFRKNPLSPFSTFYSSKSLKINSNMLKYFLLLSLLTFSLVFSLEETASTTTKRPTTQTNHVEKQLWEAEDKLENSIWRKTHERFIAETEIHANSIQIVFYGDSITAGWAWKGKQVWEKEYSPLHAVNYGMSADRTQHVIWRIQNGEINGLHPKVLVLKIGTNNIVHSEAQGIARGIKTIIEIVHHRLPHTKVLLLGILPRAGKNSTQLLHDESIRNVNSLIAKFADGKQTVFLDMRAHFTREDGKQLRKELFVEGVHLLEAGYQVWAEAMNPTLKKMLG
jgi:lysophospholipase L1-like esterase